MTLRKNKLILHVFLLFAFTTSVNASGLFWDEWIETALVLRDSYEKSSGINSLETPLISLDSNTKSKLLSSLSNQTDTNNPWYFYYSGIITSHNINQRDEYLSHALDQSIHDPGTTWLLFVKFAENDIDVWEFKAFEQLGKQLFQSGAEQSILISKQLLHMAITFEEFGESKKADRYYQWAKKFDTQDLGTLNRIAWINFPQNISQWFGSISELIQLSLKSWNVQLKLLSFFYNLFKLWGIVLSISLVTVFLFRYLPAALHSISDLFPSSVPLTLKMVLSTAAYCSLAGFGIIPFMWLSVFIIKRHILQKEKTLFYIILITLVCAPLDTHLQTIFSRIANPDLSPTIFYRSVYEGFSNEAYKNVVNKIKANPNDNLLLLSATNYALKSSNYNAALYYAEKAIKFNPDDPVVLVTSGNVAFLQNDIERALQFYEKAINIDKNSAEANYNAGQCYLRKFETSNGMSLINRAVEILPVRLNTFIKHNDRNFPDSTPPLRQIMFADYSPLNFWKNSTTNSLYKKEMAASLWGAYFLGFSPWMSFIISIILLVTILLLQIRPIKKRNIRIRFECRYCGRVICKKCKTDSLCPSCLNATRFIQNEQKLGQIRQTIVQKSKLTKQTSLLLLDMLFPGIRNFLQDEKFHWSSVIQIVASSCVITMYVIIIDALSVFSTIQEEQMYFLIAGLVYSMYFVIKNGITLYKEVLSYFHSMEG